MKLRNGRPTKKFIRDLVDKHGLIIYPLDTYATVGNVVYGYRKGANEIAALIAEELRGHGFYVKCRAAERIALLGAITIISKDK